MVANCNGGYHTRDAGAHPNVTGCIERWVHDPNRVSCHCHVVRPRSWYQYALKMLFFNIRPVFGKQYFGPECHEIYDGIVPRYMTRLSRDIWRDCPEIYDEIVPRYMARLSRDIWRDCPEIYGEIVPRYMTRLSRDIWRDCPEIYDEIVPRYMTRLSRDIWRDCPEIYDGIVPRYMTRLSRDIWRDCPEIYDEIVPRYMTGLSRDIWRDCPEIYDEIVCNTGDIAMILGQSITGQKTFCWNNVYHELQCTKVDTFNSAFYGTLFVMIPCQLIELHFSLFTEHINQASLYTPKYVVKLELAMHLSSDL